MSTHSNAGWLGLRAGDRIVEVVQAGRFRGGTWIQEVIVSPDGATTRYWTGDRWSIDAGERYQYEEMHVAQSDLQRASDERD